jgi:hypothetical protein
MCMHTNKKGTYVYTTACAEGDLYDRWSNTGIRSTSFPNVPGQAI